MKRKQAQKGRKRTYFVTIKELSIGQKYIHIDIRYGNNYAIKQKNAVIIQVYSKKGTIKNKFCGQFSTFHIS